MQHIRTIFVFTLLFVCLAFTTAARAQEKKVIDMTEPPGIYQISAEDLLNSDAGKAFKKGKYEKALEEFRKLTQTYPTDITIRRYIGLSYDGLGEYAKAIDAYDEGLLFFPYHVPTHFYKAMAFLKLNEKQKGLNELKFVAKANPEGPYGARAKEAIAQVEKGIVVRMPKAKAWQIYGRIGSMYDTNVNVSPDQKTLRGANNDQNSWRWEFEGNVNYTLHESRKLRVHAEYGISQSLHDDSLDEFNFTFQRAALVFSYAQNLLGRDWLHQLRNDFSLGFLDGDLFSFGNTTTLRTSTSFLPQTRNSFYVRYGYTEFGPDGSNPPFLSRDGQYGGAGVSTTLFNQKGNAWITLTYAWDGANVEGRNFDVSGNSIQVLLHFPLVEKLTADVFGSYRRSEFNNFNGDIFVETRGRQDDSFTLSAVVSRPLGENFTSRFFYRYFDTQSANDIFENHRHIFGTELAFEF